MAKETTALRKRQQIDKQNKIMFIWIAGASVVIGIAIVLSIFLIQKIGYKEKVISEMNTTKKVLDKNLTNINELEKNLNKLNSNEALRSTKLNETDKPVQPILDAMPAKANAAALASSFQVVLLTGVPGVVVESINVDQGEGEATSTTSSNSSVDISSNQTGELTFSFAVKSESGNMDALRSVLEKVERSIRPINITQLKIESQGDKIVMTASGVSYYKPAQTVQLIDKVVKR